MLSDAKAVFELPGVETAMELALVSRRVRSVEGANVPIGAVHLGDRPRLVEGVRQSMDRISSTAHLVVSETLPRAWVASVDYWVGSSGRLPWWIRPGLRQQRGAKAIFGVVVLDAAGRDWGIADRVLALVSLGVPDVIVVAGADRTGPLMSRLVMLRHSQVERAGDVLVMNGTAASIGALKDYWRAVRVEAIGREPDGERGGLEAGRTVSATV